MDLSLKDKYKDLIAVVNSVGASKTEIKEEGGKLKIWATVPYQLEKDAIWDAIKKSATWEQDVMADIKAEKTDIYGVWTVKSGDTLSKIAKSAYDDVKAYMKIFEANKNILKSPDMIQVGQKITIPNK